MFELKKKSQKWWILLGVTSCISMFFLDITIVPVSLPTIQRSLSLTDTGIQWVINGYILALTLFVIAGGRFGDRIGHKKAFLIGLSLFSLSSALCGLATTQFFLVSSRILQGTGAALMIPSAISIIFQTFPEEQRGKAMGLYVSIGSIFLSLGPLLGGLLSQYLSWRLIFLINIPIALVGFLLVASSVPHREGKERKFDGWGFLLTTLGICSLVVPLMMVKDWKWSSPLTLGLLVLGLCFFLLLFFVDRKAEDPYIDVTLFKNRNFTGAVIAIFTTQFLLMVVVFWALYFQNVFGFSPSKAGLISMTAHVPIIFIAPLAGHLFDKYGPFFPITLGFILVAGALFWFVQHIDDPAIPTLLGTIIPFGCGIPLIFSPSVTFALNTSEGKQWGLTSGTVSMLRHFGGTLGVATIGSLFFWAQATQFSSDLKMHKETLTTNPTQFSGLLAKTPKSMEAFNALSKEAQPFVKQAYTNATVDAFWTINIFAICVAIFGLIFTLLFIRKRVKN